MHRISPLLGAISERSKAVAEAYGDVEHLAPISTEFYGHVVSKECGATAQIHSYIESWFWRPQS